MRTRTIAAVLVLLVVGLAAATPAAGAVDGTLKLGGIILDEIGDRSAVQETYNIYDGFNLAQIRLDGLLNSSNYLKLDLQDLNLDSRKGDLVYRVPGALKLTAGYDQHRQIFSPDGGMDSRRKDWKVGAELTPVRRFSLSGYFNYLERDGDRLSYPARTVSGLGTGYDNSLWTGQVNAEFRENGRGAAISFRKSEYDDALNPVANRAGYVWSGRLYAPMPFYDKWNNLVRGAIGVRKLSGSGLDYRLMSFQYTAVVQPVSAFQLKYLFDASQVDDAATSLRTDRFQNDLEAAYFYKYGRFNGGYGYEINDDDRTLTSYDSWNAGTEFHYGKYVSAKVDYASRVKKDQEELTLLKDLEATQTRAKLDVRPLDGLVFGGDYAKREREFPDIDVQADGEVAGAFGRYTYAGWGAVSADYSYATDDYKDLAGGFSSCSNIVTGRLEFERVRNLRLATGFTYLDISRDLDIEKGMFFAEGAYTLLDHYRVEVKYNGYSYDDYILLDRYYTANVVQINLAYDFRLK